MVSVLPSSTATKTVAQTSGFKSTNETADPPFSNLVHSLVNQMQDLDKKATDAVTGIINGNGMEIHQALIATQKASLVFELSLEVRNKAVAAYQQMMGMQF